MDMFSCAAPIMIEDTCLESWTRIGSGGFGQIYKARHKKLCCEVAIKLLYNDDGNSSSLLRELDLMRQGSNPYVIQVLGVFRGLPPTAGPPVQLGLVMEFMERGCLSRLQECLCGAPPWPLVFSLSHQVALGINFLHNLSPPLLHLDLKPSNVLLDSYLKAKLTDFGLARVYRSVSKLSKEGKSEAGTLSYLPPEAFSLSYSPCKASDIYSFGILLWSIVSGKQPYAHVLSEIVTLLVPQGERPSLEELRLKAAGIAGLTRLMDLMQRCWDMKASERPSSYDCTLVTEELFKMHKHAVNSAVLQVLQKLDQPPADRLTDQFQRVHISQQQEQALIGCFDVPTGKGPVQEVAGCTPNQDQARMRDTSVPYPVRVSDASTVTSSSVKPISSPLPPPSPSSSSKSSKSSKPQQRDPLQRQYSSPDSPPSGITIHCSNVTGCQIGNNNTLYIHGMVRSERRRHPTAPSKVDLQTQRKDKKAGLS